MNENHSEANSMHLERMKVGLLENLHIIVWEDRRSTKWKRKMKGANRK